MVRFNGPLAKGDCGSWVIDAETRGLYGHIVAGCERTGTAYIMSAQNVFKDVKERLWGSLLLDCDPTFEAISPNDPETADAALAEVFTITNLHSPTRNDAAAQIADVDPKLGEKLTSPASHWILDNSSSSIYDSEEAPERPQYLVTPTGRPGNSSASGQESLRDLAYSTRSGKSQHEAESMISMPIETMYQRSPTNPSYFNTSQMQKNLPFYPSSTINQDSFNSGPAPPESKQPSPSPQRSQQNPRELPYCEGPYCAEPGEEKNFVRDFMRGSDKSGICHPQADKVEDFCFGASLEFLREEKGKVSEPLVAWLDERSFESGKRCSKTHRGPLTARGLYNELKKPVRYLILNPISKSHRSSRDFTLALSP